MRAYGFDGYKVFGDGRDAFGDPRVGRTYEEVVADRESRDAAAAARAAGDTGNNRPEAPRFMPIELADVALQGVLASEAEQLTVAGLPEAE